MQTCPPEGTFYENYSGQGRVFKSLSELSGSMVKCSSACLQYQPVCIGFRYEENKICELLDDVIPESSPEERQEMYVSENWIAGNQSFY